MDKSIFYYKDILTYIFNIIDISDFYDLMCTCKLAFKIGKQLSICKKLNIRHSYYSYVHLRVIDYEKLDQVYDTYVLLCEGTNYNTATIPTKKLRFKIKVSKPYILQGYEEYYKGNYLYYADIRSEIIYNSILPNQDLIQQRLNEDKEYTDYYHCIEISQEITRKSDKAVFSFYKRPEEPKKVINNCLTTKEKKKLKAATQFRLLTFKLENKYKTE